MCSSPGHALPDAIFAPSESPVAPTGSGSGRERSVSPTTDVAILRSGRVDCFVRHGSDRVGPGEPSASGRNFANAVAGPPDFLHACGFSEALGLARLWRSGCPVDAAVRSRSDAVPKNSDTNSVPRCSPRRRVQKSCRGRTSMPHRSHTA